MSQTPNDFLHSQANETFLFGRPIIIDLISQVVYYVSRYLATSLCFIHIIYGQGRSRIVGKNKLPWECFSLSLHLCHFIVTMLLIALIFLETVFS